MVIADGLTDVELVDLAAMHFVSLHRHVRSLSLPSGLFVVAKTNELCVSQVISARPLQELDLC